MLGVLVAGGVVRPITGVLTILFMLLTLSVASQLLARAAYMSGATVHGLDVTIRWPGCWTGTGGPQDEGPAVPTESDKWVDSRPERR